MSEIQSLETQFTDNREVLTHTNVIKLLPAVNSEIKALLVSSFEQGKYYGQSDLHSLITDLPGTQDIYIGRRTNQMTDCKGSLEPTGIVTKRDGANEFSLTETGEKIAQPLAAGLLLISDKYNIPLRHILGQANAGINRIEGSPYRRLSIASTLLNENSPMTRTKLTDEIGEHSATIQAQIDQMAAVGLIENETWDYARDEVVYRANRQADVSGIKDEFMKTLVGYMQDNQRASLTEITEICRQQGIRPDLSPNELRQRVATRMRTLERDYSVVEREGKNESKVELTQEQRQLWTEVISLVNAVGTDESFGEKITAELQKKLADPEFVKRTITRSIEASSQSMRRTGQTVGQLVLKVLGETERPLSAAEIMHTISQKKIVSNHGVRIALESLMKSGRTSGYEINGSTVFKLR